MKADNINLSEHSVNSPAKDGRTIGRIAKAPILQDLSPKSMGVSVNMEVNNENKVKYPKVITYLPLFAMLVVILTSLIKHENITDIAKLSIITMILTGAVTLYMQLCAESLLNKRLSKSIIILSYLISICMLLVIPNPEILSFWMIGGLVVAMLIDSRLGLLIQFNLVILLGITLDVHPKIIIQNLIICVLMSILAEGLKSKATIIYCAIIILSVNVTLSYAMNNFIFDKVTNVNYYYFSLLSIFAVITVAFVLSILYQNMKDQPIIRSDLPLVGKEPDHLDTTDQKVTAESIQISNELEEITSTSLEVLCNMDNDLLQRLKNFSENLYQHAIFIGDLSGRAAKEIGADEMLAKAGGLYHEIGRINGKQYIEEGLTLAQEYTFPKELKAILKEHNIKYDKPSSVEAAIVMLSDNVVSTIEYIEKTEENKYTPNKIIENIFQLRLEKGTFDTSGITLKDYKKLKEFYQKEFNKSKAE